MEPDDPYRGGLASVGSCPRCHGTVSSTEGTAVLACDQGCGEWYARDYFDVHGAWHAIVPRTPPPQQGAAWPWIAAPCPICRGDLVVAYREELRFDYCGSHGIWLDAGAGARFFELFSIGARAAT